MSTLSPVGGQFEHIEKEFTSEPIGRPMLVALLFHGLLAAGAFGFALIAGFFPHNVWGGANDGGAIAVQLVSSAVPLPQDKPPSENVLATETPSEAPSTPAPSTKATVDESAIAIASKTSPLKKPSDKHQEAVKNMKPPVIPPPVVSRNPSHVQPNPKLDNKAQFGEQASTNMQRAMQSATTSANGQVAVSSGSKGFNYPYYIEGIQRKFNQSSYRGEVDPRTPTGSRAYIFFTIRRDGAPTDIRMDRSSGSPTLDRACLRAAQRVDTYGPLPSPPSEGNPSVSYYCEY
jgi:periplasmic protein TonB